MKNLEEKPRLEPRKPLIFKIDGQQFESEVQYMTGLELKQLAGIPPETDLFLAVEEGYEPEQVGNNTSIDLARKDVEEFFVTAKLKFTINGSAYISYKQYLTGTELRRLGKINPADNLFLQIKSPFRDDLITDEEEVDLARPGKEHFISKPRPMELVIIVNAREKAWKEPTISFEQVVALAFGSYDNNPNKGYTVTFSRGYEPKSEGTMVKGSIIHVKNKMIFDVTATDKS